MLIKELAEALRNLPKADLAVKIEASPDLATALLKNATDCHAAGFTGVRFSPSPSAVLLETNPALAGMTGIIHYQSGRKEYI